MEVVCSVSEMPSEYMHWSITGENIKANSLHTCNFHAGETGILCLGGWISELSKINDFHGENKHKINIFIILLFFVLYH